MLEVDNIQVRYGNIVALQDTSFRVDAGEIVTLIGANGAGKTTSLRSVSGLLPLSAGQIRFEGQRIDTMRPDDIVRLGIAHSPEGRRVFPGLTVAENLELGATPWRKRSDRIDADIERVYALFPRLKERRAQLAWSMSGGEQQMLAMARALMSRPKVLLMDEPSMGLSPLMVDKIFEVVRDVYAQGVTVLLVEQNASRALSIANRGYVMESGLITMTGDAKTMLNDPKVRAAYLGE